MVRGLVAVSAKGMKGTRSAPSRAQSSVRVRVKSDLALSLKEVVKEVGVMSRQSKVKNRDSLSR